MAVGAGGPLRQPGPVQLLGGLGFALLPTTASFSTQAGLRIMGMVLYPLPQIHRNLSAQAQLSYDILSNSFHCSRSRWAQVGRSSCWRRLGTLRLLGGRQASGV